MTATLYRDVILDHSRHPRNSGRLAPCTHQARAANPLCSDELELTLNVAGDRIDDIRAVVRGCVISQAGASLMTTAVLHQSAGEALARADAFRRALEEPGTLLPPGLRLLQPLLELREHRSRIGCALLAWVALERAFAGRPPPGV